ncbi:histidine kinase [Apibacter sp. HY039]|uniref:histidine kinase n=1 Tax=Apibacter sp. HY039 TaxID=2501476 RepID=UPI000FEC14DD|nr:histidine kinase [Apibacter sp. HY039]
MNLKLIFFITILGYFNFSYSQDSLYQKKLLNESAKKLSKVLTNNSDNNRIANEYENLANELEKTNDYAKALNYLEKARNLYLINKNNIKVSAISRKMAHILELNKDNTKAINKYEEAGKYSSDNITQKLNINDVNRLKETGNPMAQKQLILDNIVLAEKGKLFEEKVNSLQQLANINLKEKENKNAIVNLENALKSTTNSKEASKIKRKISNIYYIDNQINKSIEINLLLLEEALKDKDTQTEIEQRKILSDLYIKSGLVAESEKQLHQAFEIAMQTGNTIEAGNCAEKLISIFKTQNNYKKSYVLFSDFLSKLPQLIAIDSSLVDNKLFEVNETKIHQLEKEKVLKDKLIKQKNLLTYILTGILVLVFIFTFFIIKTLFSIKKKNKKIALQSLRREMNPHFIFNSLNSINLFISENDELKANKYLTSYSKLMRTIMDNSNNDFIKLSLELELIKEYLDLEKLRFYDKFSYKINISPTLDTECIYIPNMIIQPNLENSIWHGLRYKEGKGSIIITFTLKDNQLEIKIQDNGIGLSKSKSLKTENQKIYNSRGLNNIMDRIKLLNDLHNSNIQINIYENEVLTGVTTEITIPLIKK